MRPTAVEVLKHSSSSTSMNLLLVCCVALIISAAADGESENRKPTPQIIHEDGYPVEIHHVTTPDGYILEIHRIPGNGKPVLLMHGLLFSSSDYVISGPKKALGYLLADNGYDVWMGNARGNTYSKNMTNMTAAQKQNYWNFSWHEIGHYDIPTMIDFILATTGYSKLFYVGHSQGTTSFFVMASTRPEYNAKITAMFAMAPTAYLRYATSPLIQLISLTSIPLFYGLVDGFEFLPNSKVNDLLATLCTDGVPTQGPCALGYMAFFGMSSGQLNHTLLPIMLGHSPAGASNRQWLHYGQVRHCDCFRWYDYGLTKNPIVYKSLIPPKYDLSMITAPIYFYCGAQDKVATEKDVDRLIAELVNAEKKVKIQIENQSWEHLDFTFGIDARTQVYDRIMTVMQTYPN